MCKQDNDVASYIRLVRRESLWGRSQTLNNYKRYIEKECDELRLAIELDDRINIREELADIYMILLFYQQEKKECVMVASADEFDVDSKLLDIVKQAEIFNITLEKLQWSVCQKLEFRYPQLIPYQQLSFSYEDFAEEASWERQKKDQKLLEYCTCMNEKCSNYHRVYDGTELRLRLVRSRNGKSVFCPLCKRETPLSDAAFFYGVKKDLNVVLRACAEYFSSRDKKSVCQKYNISIETFTSVVHKCEKSYDLFLKYVKVRFRDIELSGYE